MHCLEHPFKAWTAIMFMDKIPIVQSRPTFKGVTKAFTMGNKRGKHRAIIKGYQVIFKA